MGLNDVLNTARDALAAQTFGLTVTGQNVSNVNTPGYTRRVAVLQTRELGNKNFGIVEVAGLERVADDFVNQRHLSLVGLSAHADMRDQLLASTEAVFNDFSGTGFGEELNALFSSFSALASRPADLTTRATVLERAETLALRVREASERISDQRTEIFGLARSTIATINAKVDSIAELSGRINLAQAAGEEPADLKDKRDAQLLELSELVEVRTFTDGNGQLVVQGAGTTLVQAATARHLEVDIAEGGNLRILAQSEGGAGSEVTRHLSGGHLAGLVDARDDDLVSIQSDLDTFAFQLATAVNGAHAAGFGLDGVAGRNLFAPIAAVEGAAASLRVDDAVVGAPERLGAASNASVVPGDAGNAVTLAQLADSPIAGLGGRTPAEAYARLVGNVGNRKAEAEQNLETRRAMEAQIEVTRQSISGVSLDEEMVSLTKYQRAFEAASRVLTTADRLLEELINTLGR